jgi:hypothetical protein
VGGGARVNDVRIRDIEPGRALGISTVLGAQGGPSLSCKVSLPDTRDHILAARQGQLVQLTAMLAGGAIGSDYDFGRFALDARQFWSPGQGEHVIAAAVAGGRRGARHSTSWCRWGAIRRCAATRAAAIATDRVRMRR